MNKRTIIIGIIVGFLAFSIIKWAKFKKAERQQIYYINEYKKLDTKIDYYKSEIDSLIVRDSLLKDKIKNE